LLAAQLPIHFRAAVVQELDVPRETTGIDRDLDAERARELARLGQASSRRAFAYARREGSGIRAFGRCRVLKSNRFFGWLSAQRRRPAHEQHDSDRGQTHA